MSRSGVGSDSQQRLRGAVAISYRDNDAAELHHLHAQQLHEMVLWLHDKA